MGRLAYLFDCFPALSETFIQREIRGLGRLGVEPMLVSNLEPEPTGMHAADQILARRTFYIFTPKRIGEFILANLALLIKGPGRYLKTVKSALAGGEGSPKRIIKNLGQVAGAAVLARRLAKEGVTHIHAHFALGAAGLAVYVGMLTGIPYSLSIHGSDVLLPQARTREKLEGACFIVTNCEYHVRHLRNRFPSLDHQKFYLLRLMLELASNLWQPSPPPRPSQPLRILNVARLHPVKAQDVLIRACAKLVEYKVPFICRIVGEGPNRSKLEGLISDLGLRDRVELTGAMEEPEVAAMFDWCHVFVLSSISEGTPMTIVEAMAKGRPVLAPAITALPEMVLDGQTGWLYPQGSVSDLAERLAAMAGEPEKIQTMGARGARQARENHDQDKNAQRLRDIFAREAPSLGLHLGEDVRPDW